jgi:crotonobetainyl-CoA:carnitine CoA-transferase CaiB-like acyl-CoA transferase
MSQQAKEGAAMFEVLRDIRVLDFGKFVAAPSATWLLSNMGAQVIKVEPTAGAPDREPFRIADDLDGAGFLQLHSNKRSLCLDHTSPQGRAVLEKLVRASDVMVCGAPASTLARQSIDYATLSALNPRLIYLNVSAYTSQGPRANEIGFDGIGQVMSGATYMSGFDAQPTRSFCSWVDVSTGIYAAFAIACALIDRAQSGRGHYLETSLMMSGYAAMSWLLVEQAASGRNRTRSGNRAQSSGPSDIFRTRDSWIVVQVVGDGLFAKVAKLVGHAEWIGDPRFRTDNDRAEHGAALSEGVAAWCAQFTTEEALQRLREARVPGAHVNSLQQALEEPQVAALGLTQTVTHPARAALKLLKAPIMVDGELAQLRSRPPLAGEHSAAILGELGYSEQEVAALAAAGVIGFSPPAAG